MSRRVSLHDRDADGITDAAAAKTASVVDTLIAPDVAAGGDRIVHIPVGKIVPHPRNRKILDEDVDDLVASFKAGEPIINALGVTAAADWNTGKPDDLKPIQSDEFIITAGGHRRLRAAEIAGLKTVPCVIRATFAGADGRRAALLENLHRQDLDVFEEAEAFAELVAEPYKMSQRELSTVVFGKVNQQSHISKRLKLLKLPTTVREKVRLGQMKIADALALAGVVENRPVFDLALTKIDQWHMDAERAVRVSQQEYDAKVSRQRIAEQLAADGVRILDRRPAWYLASTKEPTRLDELKLDAGKHAAEPCHAAYVGDGHIGETQAMLVCEKPGRHVKAGESKLKVRKPIEEQLVRRGRGDADADARRDRREQKKLWPARAVIARQVAFDDQLDEKAEAELITRGVLGNTFDDAGSADTWKALCAIVGVTDLPGYPNDDAREQLVRRFPARTVQRLVALSFFEARLRSTWKTWGSDGKFYLDLLAGHGYQVAHIETKKLAGAKPRTLTSGCRVCGTDEPPAGVTWVDADLCSACSDAQEAGWVEGPQPIEVPRPYQQVDDEQGFIECLECEHGQPTEGCDCTSCFCNPANVDEPAAVPA